MKLPIYQIDAFTSEAFGGNPAAVIPLQKWPANDLMQNIAIENNLSETAFFVPEGNNFHLRWFTPGGEVDLCGHATLATAFVLFEELGHKEKTITFSSNSGELFVHKTSAGLMMDFPAWERKKTQTPELIIQALGAIPDEYYEGHDHMAVFENPSDILNMRPDFRHLKRLDARGLLVTAPGEKDQEHDFISRAFFPGLNIDEDPVTGSAHCLLTPYWAERLGKTTLKAHQASERGGNLLCKLNGKRVEITGQAVQYMKGEIDV